MQMKMLTLVGSDSFLCIFRDRFHETASYTNWKHLEGFSHSRCTTGVLLLLSGYFRTLGLESYPLTKLVPSGFGHVMVLSWCQVSSGVNKNTYVAVTDWLEMYEQHLSKPSQNKQCFSACPIFLSLSDLSIMPTLKARFDYSFTLVVFAVQCVYSKAKPF